MIVDSAPGKGTRIVVRFPVHDTPPAEVADKNNNSQAFRCRIGEATDV